MRTILADENKRGEWGSALLHSGNDPSPTSAQRWPAASISGRKSATRRCLVQHACVVVVVISGLPMNNSRQRWFWLVNLDR